MAAATDLDYSSLQDIREESGNQHIVKLETPSGAVNGSNTVFTVGRTYIVDRDYDDTIDVGTASGDVIVYDDAVAVSVSAVDTTTGVIREGKPLGGRLERQSPSSRCALSAPSVFKYQGHDCFTPFLYG